MTGMGPNWLARLAAARYAPAAGVGLLAGAAVAQAIGWAAAYSAPGSSIIANVALFGLLALASTVPLIILPPVPAAIAVTAANVLAIVTFGTTTVAGMAAQVIAAFLLGSRARDSALPGGPRRGGAQLLAAGLALPFLGLALAGHGSAVLLASLVPAAAAGGIAVRARREADAQTGTREVLTDTLTQHMARGERARIARELHDVVAHHISMIAVQAETARLTTPGCPRPARSGSPRSATPRGPG